MTVSTKQRSSSILLLLVPALFVLAPAPAEAQVDPDWDHYKVYELQMPITGGPTVFLSDQFGSVIHDVFSLDKFQTPVVKQHGPLTFGITDPKLHYSWWKITEAFFSGLVAVNNQFGDQTLQVGNAQYLLNPALKNEPGTPPVRNHYKCYECQGDAVNAVVTLTDQFDTWTTEVAFPRYFCNPVKKTVLGGTTFPIVDVRQHYVCYVFTPPDTNAFPATLTDQFVQNRAIPLNGSQLVCVPTDKLVVTQAARSTWGRLKTLYR